MDGANIVNIAKQNGNGNGHAHASKSVNGVTVNGDVNPNDGDAKANGNAIPPPPLEWDWDIEHADRRREAQADAALHGATPFEVDRRVLKDVVLEHMRTPVARIVFLSAGTFHKAYLITLTTSHQLIARVARRFMPRIKTESEIATLRFLREQTNVPVPQVHFFDANPYNRLGGEWILMSKAPGVPLSSVYHSLSYAQLVRLLDTLARLMVPLFGHRFAQIGSLYDGLDPTPPPPTNPSTSTPTPTAPGLPPPPLPLSPWNSAGATPTLTRASSLFAQSQEDDRDADTPTPRASYQYAAPRGTPFHVGPIVSWPFFGTHRGLLPSPSAVPRGPFSTSAAYVEACVEREVKAVQREGAGEAAAHRLHLDPGEVASSRHHRLELVPGDESDESDEWGLEESEEEDNEEGPGDVMYRDYRRAVRGTFLVRDVLRREEAVRGEMARWARVTERLEAEWRDGAARAGIPGGPEEFALDAHDLSLENVFVDEDDPAVITCIIDWESTTTRPLWAAAHLPAFLQGSPFTAKLFREAVGRLANGASAATSTSDDPAKLARLAREWLHHERTGMRLRMAHRVVEWDGWEEGLVDSILGPEDIEGEWFAHEGEDENAEEHDEHEGEDGHLEGCEHDHEHDSEHVMRGAADELRETAGRGRRPPPKNPKGGATTGKPAGKLFAKDLERERERLLDTTGDICGGRGGELGRRLEAWLVGNLGANQGEDDDVHGDLDIEHGYEAEGEGSGEGEGEGEDGPGFGPWEADDVN
ncbi:hypothetical protein C8R47DRAFT_980813 [Mycena vitilis]|nr:hypothetical protein C8R47DRAFT_980813 [Mycena vitilis]